MSAEVSITMTRCLPRHAVFVVACNPIRYARVEHQEPRNTVGELEHVVDGIVVIRRRPTPLLHRCKIERMSGRHPKRCRRASLHNADRSSSKTTRKGAAIHTLSDFYRNGPIVYWLVK